MHHRTARTDLLYRCAIRFILLISAALPTSSFAQLDASKSTTPGELYKKASPAVVLIELHSDNGELTATGSGFLISADGKILTNYHVVAHSKQATIRLANKDAYDDITVLDIDKRKDIAVIKIKAIDQPFLTLGKSGTVDVGDKVFSLSTPLGLLQNTLSEGIISGIRLADGYRYFQVSAPISHGSSGGPIFNSSGEVIGIAAATLEEGQNLNFAIPIDYAKGMLTSSQPRSLASIYEPEPKVEATSSATSASAATVRSVIPEEMKKSSMIYLQSKLHVWTLQDAKNELGDSVGYRQGPLPGQEDIFAFSDPTKQLRSVELAFSKKDLKLADLYGYPWNLTWDECKHLWGSNVRIVKNADGTKFYSYKDRRLNILVNKHGDVLSLGLF